LKGHSLAVFFSDISKLAQGMYVWQNGNWHKVDDEKKKKNRGDEK
jgi:hypothetical protein